MKKKRQKSTKKSKKNRQRSKNNKLDTEKQIEFESLQNDLPIIAGKDLYNTANGSFNIQILYKNSNRPHVLTTAFEQACLSTYNFLQFNIGINKFLVHSVSNKIQGGLDDKSKYLCNIYEAVFTLLTEFLLRSVKELKLIELSEIELNTQPEYSVHQFQSDSQMNLSILDQSQVAHTKEVDEEQNYENNEKIRKSRPNYLIERDCHVFGGCVSDDADDEFFISSGAVYQSWPYVYEPGYQMHPLPQLPSPLLSISDEQIDYTSELDSLTNHTNKQPAELPSYSLQNYGINFFHIEQPYKKNKKHKKRRPHNNNSLSTSSSIFESDLTSDDSSDDDSDSYRAYKYRHAIGLNSFNQQYNSQSSLSDLGNQKLGQLRTNLYHTDSSSCDEYLRAKLDRNLWQKQRLTTSFTDYNETYGRPLSNVKSMKYASCNNQCLSLRNLIF